MKTSPVTPTDLARSVIAVPPLCLDAELGLAVRENGRLVRHIEEGGVGTVLWGGNAQLQHWPASRYGELLDMAEATGGPATWVIPSAGPDYGKLLDEARVLHGRRFPAALMLPMAGHWTADGVARAVQDFTDLAGLPAMLYIRAADYLAPDRLASFVAEGRVCGIKYAVTRENFTDDSYLARLVAAIGAERIVSGFGELPALPHLQAFGLAGFTAGAVCITPRLSMAVLAALKARDWSRAAGLIESIRPLEALRERHSPIRVIHEAVRLAGVAATGPVYPMLSNVGPELFGPIAEAVDRLREAELRLPAAAALAAE